MRRRSAKIVGVVLIGGLSVVAAYWVLARNSRDAGHGAAADPAATSEAEVKRVPVKVMPLRPEPITDYRLLPGTLEAWEDIDLSAKAGGTVEWIGPKEGDRVSSGEVIMRLDTALLVARLNQAKAQLTQAEKHYQRIEKLVRDRVVQAAELDAALAQRDVARASLEVARVNLDNATLRSPIDGVVDRIFVDRGEHVNPGEVVAKIVQTDRLKVLVNVPERDVRYFNEGQKAAIFPEKVDLGQMVAGKIFYVAVTADPFSRTYPMRIEIDNRDGGLRPGMIVRVGLIRQRVERALVAPLYAIVDRGDHKAVFVEKDGKVQERPVETGIIEGNRVQLVSGVREGDRLVVVGQRDLVDGQEVEVEQVVESGSFFTPVEALPQ